ncbi:MAG: hypothetical protein R3263_02885, partial [Myxococcota bacterium]|nr:hypothetical protein [Myxococcota bacterium]
GGRLGAPMASPPSQPPSAPPAPDGAPAEDPRALRWALIRDLAHFSGKAALEALGAQAQIPVARVAGVAGQLFHPRDPAFLFREVLRLGDRFDRFVDIFGAERRRRAGEALDAGAQPASFDELAERVERVLVEQQRLGAITSQAKDAVDRALDAVQRRPAPPAPRT